MKYTGCSKWYFNQTWFNLFVKVKTFDYVVFRRIGGQLHPNGLKWISCVQQTIFTCVCRKIFISKRSDFCNTLYQLSFTKTTHLLINNDYFLFSFHEMGKYDVPAAINYILNVTKTKKVIHIAHSQGTTIFYAFATTRPEMADKVLVHLSFGPVTTIPNSKSLFTAFAPLMKQIQVRNIIFVHEKNYFHALSLMYIYIYVYQKNKPNSLFAVNWFMVSSRFVFGILSSISFNIRILLWK